MFVDYDKGSGRLPVKIWLKDESQIEPECLEQAQDLASLPFVYRYVALMPDTHPGYGMPIGGVAATTNVLMPYGVGMDIGCGMQYVGTDVLAEEVRSCMTGSGSLVKMIVGDIMRDVPVGFRHHNEEQSWEFNWASLESSGCGEHKDLKWSLWEKAKYSIGTLGGGNHFIELTEDEGGYLGILIHTGSRNIGAAICKHFHKLARQLNETWYSSIPKPELAFLPFNTNEGVAYWRYMSMALQFAQDNRDRIMARVMDIVSNRVDRYLGTGVAFLAEPIDCHHNFASVENHFGRNVLVHRKGAIRAREGDPGIIPGSMGSNSYIVTGKGSPDSFMSCSHGAGRRLSRNKAKEEISIQKVMEDLKDRGVVLGKSNKEDVAEECRMAYKDIDEVMANQEDLIEIEQTLKGFAVIKG